MGARYRTGLEKHLDETVEGWEKEEKYPVTTDVLESLIGKSKSFLERIPGKGLGSLVLSIAGINLAGAGKKVIKEGLEKISGGKAEEYWKILLGKEEKTPMSKRRELGGKYETLPCVEQVCVEQACIS